MTKTYIIANRISGADLGRYQADDVSGALDALAQETGYGSYANLLAEIGGSEDELIVTELGRYTIHYIADESCDSLKSDVLASSDGAAGAKRLAVEHAGMGTYGAGVRDTQTGAIDVGFGFGIAAPEDCEDAADSLIDARVKAGSGENYDTGRVESIEGDTAFVAWDSGVKTRCPVSDLIVIG